MVTYGQISTTEQPERIPRNKKKTLLTSTIIKGQWHISKEVKEEEKCTFIHTTLTHTNMCRYISYRLRSIALLANLNFMLVHFHIRYIESS